MKTPHCLAAALFAIASAVAQDHLTPDDDPLSRDVLRREIVVQVLKVPSFQPEEIAGIRRSAKGFEAFASKPSAHI
jgi:hypothetical protein